MHNAISIHDITSITIDDAKRLQRAGSYVRHIRITGKDGGTVNISLFSDRSGDLTIRKED